MVLCIVKGLFKGHYKFYNWVHSELHDPTCREMTSLKDSLLSSTVHLKMMYSRHVLDMDFADMEDIYDTSSQTISCVCTSYGIQIGQAYSYFKKKATD